MIVRLRRHRALGQPLVLVSIILVVLVSTNFLLRIQRYKSLQLTDATESNKPLAPASDGANTHIYEATHSNAESENRQEVPTQEEFEKEREELLK